MRICVLLTRLPWTTRFAHTLWICSAAGCFVRLQPKGRNSCQSALCCLAWEVCCLHFIRQLLCWQVESIRVYDCGKYLYNSNMWLCHTISWFFNRSVYFFFQYEMGEIVLYYVTVSTAHQSVKRDGLTMRWYNVTRCIHFAIETVSSSTMLTCPGKSKL